MFAFSERAFRTLGRQCIVLTRQPSLSRLYKENQDLATFAPSGCSVHKLDRPKLCSGLLRSVTGTRLEHMVVLPILDHKSMRCPRVVLVVNYHQLQFDQVLHPHLK